MNTIKVIMSKPVALPTSQQKKHHDREQRHGQQSQMKIVISSLTAVASLHRMRKDALTRGEENPTRRSDRKTVIMTAGGLAESTEEAAVCAHDLDLFVTAMLLENSLGVLSLGVLCEDLELAPVIGKRENFHHCQNTEKLFGVNLTIMFRWWQLLMNAVYLKAQL